MIKLHEEWSDYPPIRVMLAGFMGLKPKEQSNKNFAELLGMFPDGMVH